MRNELNSAYSIIEVLNTKVEEIIDSTKNKTSGDSYSNIALYAPDERSRAPTLRCKSYDTTFDDDHERIRKKAVGLGEKIDNIRDLFINSLMRKRVVEQHLKKNNSFRKTILEVVPSSNDKKELAKFIPRWLPDAIASDCNLCNTNFGVLTRRHHCRFCGDIYCNSCCYRFELFLPFYKKKVRICEHCYVKNRLA